MGNTECHGFGVFDKPVPSLFNNVFEEHGLPEDGKTVAPFIETFCSKSISAPAARTSNPQFVSSRHPCPPDTKSSPHTKTSNVFSTKRLGIDSAEKGGDFAVLRRRLAERIDLLKNRPLLRIVISDGQ